MNIITILIIFTPILLSLRGGGATDLLIQPPLLPPLPPITDLIFSDQRLAVVFPIIQNFKNLITSDPFNITSTWTGPDICSYRGFYCENPPDNHSATALASIDFNGFRLTAPTLDGFLDQLPDVALFHANSNNFAGAISPKIASLPYLYELDISNNKFIGAFPAAVLAMPGLTFLDLRFNSFSGKVPPEIFTKELDALFINNNFFVTPFPNNLDSHIIYLTLANNKFFGPIPRTISYSLSSLSEILLMNNLLTGCLPYELGFLSEVVVIDIGNNKLTGPLPWSLGCLQNVEILNFAGNLLYGPVPEAVCLLGKVVNVSLSDNYFTHVGPACWRLVKSGVLDVRKNCIRGSPLQRPAAECAAYLVRPRLCPYMHMYRHVPCRLTAAAELAPAPF